MGHMALFMITHEGADLDEVTALQEELKRNYGFSYEIIDTSKMSPTEVNVVYTLCAHWASTRGESKRDMKYSDHQEFMVEQGIFSVVGTLLSLFISLLVLSTLCVLTK